jgi:hypothetical protein
MVSPSLIKIYCKQKFYKRSAQDLIQVLGRIYRAKTKTKVLQRIIFCKDTVEDQVSKMIQDKVANIAFINDGSIDSYKIEGLTD